MNDDIIGSMEFACKVAGVKLVMVLGHTSCGAIQGACAGVELGKLTGLLNKVKPAILAENTITDNRTGENSEFVNHVANLNVDLVVKDITKRSDILRQMAENHEIAITGGMYDVATGIVNFK